MATVSSGNDEEVGQMIATAMEKVTTDGVITVEESKSLTTELEVVEGMQIDRGYISPYFITDQERQIVEYDNPLILITDKKISAIASLQHLHGENELNSVTFNLLEPPEAVTIAIEQVARLNPDAALAITRSDPGDNLDLTRNTPIWALVERKTGNQEIEIQGGEGIGLQVDNSGKSAIYSYAQRLLQENLRPLLLPQESLIVTIILPEGKKLATRTSNAAFGVVEGLSLLGTTGISQPLSAPGQLEIFREQLKILSLRFDRLVFCIRKCHPNEHLLWVLTQFDKYLAIFCNRW